MTGPKIDAIFAEEAKTLKGIFFFSFPESSPTALYLICSPSVDHFFRLLIYFIFFKEKEGKVATAAAVPFLKDVKCRK